MCACCVSHVWNVCDARLARVFLCHKKKMGECACKNVRVFFLTVRADVSEPDADPSIIISKYLSGFHALVWKAYKKNAMMCVCVRVCALQLIIQMTSEDTDKERESESERI